MDDAHANAPNAARVDAQAVESCSPDSVVPIQHSGLPNCYRITETLYRGAQPTEDGLRELARLGIKTVVSLRAFHGDRIPSDVPLAYERISFKSWHPEDEDVVRFLRIVQDPARQPVFVHCQHGADRTGTMCAIYRMVVCGWDKEQAIREMTQGGFGFHSIWKNLVRYLQEIDLERIERASGTKSAASNA